MDELVKQFRVLLGAGEDLTAENLVARASEFMAGCKQAKEDAEKEALSLKGQLEQANAKLSAGMPDAALLEEIATTGVERLSLLVDQGKITPACKDKLMGVLVGETGKRNGVALSAKANGGTKSMLSAVCEALAENKAVVLGATTGTQVLPDAHKKADETKPDAEQKEIGDAMLSGAKGVAGVALGTK